MQYDDNLSNNRSIKNEQISNAKISYFSAPITTTRPDSANSLFQIHDEVSTSQDLRITTNLIRHLRITKGDDVYRNKKVKCLPSITPSGLFNKRGVNGLVKHSGIICVDIDKLCDINEAESLKSKLTKDEVLKPVFIFISPSGRGIKVFLRININEGDHLDYFNSLLNYFKREWEIDIDKACKDVSRACFLSYDDKAFIRDDFETVAQIGSNFIAKWLDRPKVDLSDIENNEFAISRLKEYGEALKNNGICLTHEYTDWIRIGYALCELGEKGRGLYHLYSCTSSKYNKRECDDRYDELLESYDHRVGIATLFHIISENGIDIHYKDKLVKNTSIIRTAAQRLEDAFHLPKIEPQLGVIWQTGELHILFGDTACGKSVWAVQIADALSKGQSTLNVLPNPNGLQKALIYDFELGDRQFLKRYSNDNGDKYEFNENFILSDIDFKELINQNLEVEMNKLIFKQIREDIIVAKPSVVIVDNLTFLSTQTAQETSAALDLMRELDSLKKEFNLSILVLAHTPKVKNGTPLTLNELGGSKMISNFADSVSCIGKSSMGKDIRYLKQVKPSRSAEMVFDSENVICMELFKNDNFLGFKFLDCNYESEHLNFNTPSERKDEMLEMVLGLHENGASMRIIESTTGVPKSTVARWVKEQ